MADKKLMGPILGALFGIAALVFIANQLGMIGAPTATSQTIFQQYQQPSTQQPGQVAGLPSYCIGLDSFNLKVSSRNPLSTSSSYLNSAFNVVLPDGTIVATGTGTGGTTRTLTSLSVSCSTENLIGKIYATSNATLNGAFVDYNANTKREYDLLQTINNNTRLTILSTSFVNTSLQNQPSPTEGSATAMNAGDSRSGYLDVNPPSLGFSQFGSDLGILWSIDTVDAAAFTDKAIALSSSDILLKEVDCITYAKTSSVSSANRCYWTRAINTQDGLLRLKWTMNADGGAAPGATSDPLLRLYDIQYFLDTNGKINMEGTDLGGTDVGQPVQTVTFDNS